MECQTAPVLVSPAEFSELTDFQHAEDCPWPASQPERHLTPCCWFHSGLKTFQQSWKSDTTSLSHFPIGVFVSFMETDVALLLCLLLVSLGGHAAWLRNHPRPCAHSLVPPPCLTLPIS